MTSATSTARTQRRHAPAPAMSPPPSLPGVHPGTQKRSKELVDRLLTAALELLKTRDFNRLTIDELCTAANATVGSFYARFDSKDAFITALQHLVYERTTQNLRNALANGRVPAGDMEAFAAWVCGGTVIWFQRYEGFIRASSRLSGTEPEAWEPLRALGIFKTQWCLPQFRQIANTHASKAFDSSVRAGLQILHGTLNNIVVVDPGPLRLYDPGTPRVLTSVLLGCVRQGSALRAGGGPPHRRKTRLR